LDSEKKENQEYLVVEMTVTAVIAAAAQPVEALAAGLAVTGGRRVISRAAVYENRMHVHHGN